MPASIPTSSPSLDHHPPHRIKTSNSNNNSNNNTANNNKNNATKMQSSHTSSVNYRHARRFACDHCRAYKLRCERDSRMSTSCNRCLKGQLACTTTVNYPPQRRLSTTAQTQARADAHPTTTDGSGRDGATSANTTSTANNNNIQPRQKEPRLAANGSRVLPPQSSATAMHQQRNLPSPPPSLPSPQRQPAAGEDLTSSSLPTTDLQRQSGPLLSRLETASDSHVMDVGGGINMNQDQDHDCLLLDGMDFNMPDICFDAADMTLMMAENSAGGPTGSLARCDSGSAANLGLFGEDDGTTMGVNHIAWQFPNTTLPGVIMETERDSETDSETCTRPPAKSYKELLKLSLELIEDQELLDSQAPLSSKHTPGLACSNAKQHHPINRMLNHTTRFWDMLKGISATGVAAQHYSSHSSNYESTAPGSSSNSSNVSNVNDSNNNSQRNIAHDWTWTGPTDTSYGNHHNSMSLPSSNATSPRQDHLLIVNLVTTYVYLVRSCQGVFTRLYNALEVTPLSDFSTVLNLPNLQFGEFQLHNNLTIQVKVLIELITSMLLRIEETLGISQATGSKRSSRSESEKYQLSILNDPIAVSIREIILSQERMRGGMYSSELAFSEIISNIQQLLDRK